MDSSKGKSHSVRGGKSSNFFYNSYTHDNNCYSMPSNRGIFKSSRMQRHTLRCRKDYHSRGNYRVRFPYSRNNSGSIKTNKSAEDLEEEERKKKLTDTATKLLSKIKSWNAESIQSEGEPKSNSVSQVVGENSCVDEKVSSEGKPKRIAHSKKGKLTKNRTPKSFTQPSKNQYDVNKDTVKDFQNRIQHKLIEEIMQMPKENLQNVLNDPKINPIMEVKMSRLVRENKLLIAQKLRALAESKMKSPGSSTNSQLLVDIDKLIDPVIETDLSVLPFELIKQMENVFQVQFDYSLNLDSQVENSVSDIATDSLVTTEEDLSSAKELFPKAENNEDLSLYECSTDEDEEFDSCRPVEGNDAAPTQEAICSKNPELGDLQKQEVNTKGKCRKRKRSTELKLPVSDPDSNVGEKYLESLSSCSPASTQCVPEQPTLISPSTAIETTSTSCQTESNLANSSTQTEDVSSTVPNLYGIPLPRESADKNASSLLEEVNSIQILTNKLNERRFQIFLQLSKTDCLGDSISNDVTKTNFMETIANGSMSLVESLERFFSTPQHLRARSKERRKPLGGNASHRPRHPGEKKTQN